MADLIELIYDKATETEQGDLFFSFIRENYNKNEYEFIDNILSRFYQEDEPEKVVIFTRTRKLVRRKVDWYEKAISGYEHYKETNEIRRGVFRHLIDYYFYLKEMEREKGPVLFRKMVTAKTPADAIKNMLLELKEWKESEESLLIQYPFFQDFGVKLKEKSLEVDGIIVIGEAFMNVMKNTRNLLLQTENENLLDSKEDSTYIKKMPSIFLDTPISGIGGNLKYELGDKTSADDIPYELIEVNKKRKYELTDDYKMFVDQLSLKNGKNQVKTPDMTDEMLFIQMLEHRDIDFQKNKRIFVYLSDLLNEFYESDSILNYESLKERLWNLGHFHIARVYENGSFSIRSLFESLDVQQDETGRWFAFGLVSDQIRDIILRDNFVKIYSEKINDLERPLSTHLAFLVQKERILHHQKGKDMISFRLTWQNFQTSMRLNKRSKQENMKEIAKALSEIQEKDFLIKSFHRDSSMSFIVTCYNLNENELKDRSSIRSIFKKTSASQLLEDPLSVGR